MNLSHSVYVEDKGRVPPNFYRFNIIASASNVKSVAPPRDNITLLNTASDVILCTSNGGMVIPDLASSILPSSVTIGSILECSFWFL